MKYFVFAIAFAFLFCLPAGETVSQTNADSVAALQTTVIPEFIVQDESLTGCIEILTSEWKKIHPKLPLPVVVRIGKSESERKVGPVSLRLKNIPVSKLLSYLVTLSGADSYSVDGLTILTNESLGRGALTSQPMESFKLSPSAVRQLGLPQYSIPQSPEENAMTEALQRLGLDVVEGLGILSYWDAETRVLIVASPDNQINKLRAIIMLAESGYQVRNGEEP